MSSGAWSAELALAGAGGEPVDLWRSIQSHGLVDLPPMRIDDEARALEVTLPGDGGPPRLVRIAEEVPRRAVVDVEIADSDEERQVGLMNRESLPEDAGMLFVFEEDVSFGFWMKNTLIPLSIAFADGDGEIVRILDMEPCEADPCTVYEPEATYRTALEVNRGAFADWGVAEGDRLTLDR